MNCWIGPGTTTLRMIKLLMIANAITLEMRTQAMKTKKQNREKGVSK